MKKIIIGLGILALAAAACCYFCCYFDSDENDYESIKKELFVEGGKYTFQLPNGEYRRYYTISDIIIHNINLEVEANLAKSKLQNNLSLDSLNLNDAIQDVSVEAMIEGGNGMEVGGTNFQSNTLTKVCNVKNKILDCLCPSQPTNGALVEDNLSCLNGDNGDVSKCDVKEFWEGMAFKYLINDNRYKLKDVRIVYPSGVIPGVIDRHEITFPSINNLIGNLNLRIEVELFEIGELGVDCKIRRG